MTATPSLYGRLERSFLEKGISTVLVCEMKVVPDRHGLDQLEGLIRGGGLPGYTWIIFTSQNAVKVFFEKYRQEKGDGRDLSFIKYAVLGKGTAQMLQNYLDLFGKKPGSPERSGGKDRRIDFMPSSFTIHDFCQEFFKILTAQDRVLVPRAKQGSRELIGALEACPAAYTYIEAYDVEGQAASGMSQLEELPCAVFASASGVEACMEMLKRQGREWPAQVRTACIGEVTRQRLEAYGVSADLTAAVHDAEGLAEAVAGQIAAGSARHWPPME